MLTNLKEVYFMFYYKEEIINMIKPDKPDPAAAKSFTRNIRWALW